jgi:Phosphoglycerol transferase and related proteins, alkaline phosphatase superfamily
MIIEKTEAFSEPVFIHAVTMQNHGPYDDNRYEGNEVVKITGNLPKHMIEMLEVYTQGVFDADQSLKMLIDYYQNSDEKTVIFFFGDHLPAFYNKEVFTMSGLDITSGTLDSFINSRSIPYVIWSNYPIDVSQPELISPSFMSLTLMELANIQPPNYFQMLEKAHDHIAVLEKNIIVDQDNQTYFERPKHLEPLLRELELVQYDALLGSQYLNQDEDSILGNVRNKTINENLNQEIYVSNWVPERLTADPNWDGIMGIHGSNFLTITKMYVNEVEIPIVYGNSNYITTTLPRKYYESPGELLIRFENSTPSGIVLGSSQIYKLTVYEP